MPYQIDDEQVAPFTLMVEYSPVLDRIHDSIAGTQTIYKEEVMRNPLTNQPITNSEGKPLTYLKQTSIPKDGVEPIMNKDGVAFVMGVLQDVVNRAGSFADMNDSAIVYETITMVGALNAGITLNSQKYSLTSMSAWYAKTKSLRNFIYKYLSSVKNGGLKEWSENILSESFGHSDDGGMQQQQPKGILQRLFSKRQLTDNKAGYS
jgi:hypothetical protein